MFKDKKIVKSISTVLKKIGLSFKFDEERGEFTIWYDLPSNGEPVPLLIHFNEIQLTTMVIYSLTADTCIPQMAEFIIRANYNVPYGSFNMDYDTGLITFGTIIPIHEHIDEKTILKYAVLIPLQTMNQFCRGIDSVIGRMKSPEEACNACVGD